MWHDNSIHIKWWDLFLQYYKNIWLLFICFFIAPKKLELFKISKMMPLLCKLLLQCKKGTEEENNFFCQLLLHPVVFQNRNTKFPEVDLVAVNRNCLVSSVMVAWGYKPWNIVNTTENIYLLVANVN